MTLSRKRKRKSPLDRAAIMRDAHKRFADGKRLGFGWTFAQCLTTAWAAHRIRTRDRMPVPMINRPHMPECYL